MRRNEPNVEVCVGPVEQLAHHAVAQQGQVLNAVGAGGHAGHQGAQLRSGVGAFVGRQAQVLIAQVVQAGVYWASATKGPARRRPEVGVIERRRRDAPGVN